MESPLPIIVNGRYVTDETGAREFLGMDGADYDWLWKEERPKITRLRSGRCWLWTGNTNPYGYGRTSINGKAFDCHRAAWFLAYGPIPKGLYVCHTCDTPQCCNPKHLFIGSQSDNLRDYYAKDRHRRKPASAKIG